MKSERKKKKAKAVEGPLEVKDEQQSDNESSQNDGDSEPGQENPCMCNFHLQCY